MKNGHAGMILMPIKAFLICFSIELIAGMTVRNPLTVIIFLCACFLYGKAGVPERKMKLGSACLQLILSLAALAMFAGRVTAQFDNAIFKYFAGFIIFIGTFFLSELLIGLILTKLKKLPAAEMSNLNLPWEKTRISDRGIFLGTLILCILCWLPYFLYEYPAIMTADSLVQYEQVVGIRPLSNHHPVVHTLIFKAFYTIGFAITKDALKSIAFFTIAQILFMAYCCARVTVTVQRLNTGDFGVGYNRKDKHCLSTGALLSCLFFAVLPFNAVFSVTIWKDIPFAGIMMLFLITIYEMCVENLNNRDEHKIPWGLAVRFALTGLVFCLMRSNAWYAFILFVPFFLFAFRRNIIRALVAVAFVLIAVVIIKGPVMDSAGIEQADFTESLCIPLQQVARVLVSDRELSEGDLELIDAVIDRTYIHELYAPDFADNMKELVRAGHPEVIEENKGEYFGLWLRLLVRYPLDYIKAWFDVVGGYVYPDVSYDVGNTDGIMNNELGLYATPLIGGKVVVKTKEILIKLGSFVPLYGMLWSAGAYTWLLVLSLVLSVRSGIGRSFTILTVLPVCLIMTLCIAAPLVDFRYAYGVVMTMPIYASLCAIIIRGRRGR